MLPQTFVSATAPVAQKSVIDRNPVFTHIERALLPILEESRLREPIFHTLAFASSHAEYERATAPDYW